MTFKISNDAIEGKLNKIYETWDDNVEYPRTFFVVELESPQGIQRIYVSAILAAEFFGLEGKIVKVTPIVHPKSKLVDYKVTWKEVA